MTIKKLLRFGLTGLLVTGFHFFIALSLIERFSASPPMANGVAFLLATAASYFINTLWSFSASLHGRTLFRFVAVSTAGLILAMLISTAAQLLELKPALGILTVAFTVPPVTFFLHNRWTYCSK